MAANGAAARKERSREDRTFDASTITREL